MNKDDFPELWQRRESEYHLNDPQNSLFLDKQLYEGTEEITSIDEEEENARTQQNLDDSSSSRS